MSIGVAYGSYLSNRDHVYTASTLVILEARKSDELKTQQDLQQKVKALSEYTHSSEQMQYLYKRTQNVTNMTSDYDSLKSSYGVTTTDNSTVFSVWSNDKNKLSAMRKLKVGYSGIRKHLTGSHQYMIRVIRKPQITGSFITYGGHKLYKFMVSGVLIGILIGVLLVNIFDGDKNDKQ